MFTVRARSVAPAGCGLQWQVRVAAEEGAFPDYTVLPGPKSVGLAPWHPGTLAPWHPSI